jgi:hypothetical protein
MSMNLNKGTTNERIFISTQGLKKILERPIDPKYPLKGVAWTDDFKWELPIRIGA